MRRSAGRGRHGRSWLSPPGRSLLAERRARAAVGAPATPGSSALGAALAVAAEACDTVAPVTLKWPNDIVAARRPQGGGCPDRDGRRGRPAVGAVVGIGINVDWRRAEMPVELRETATLARRPCHWRPDRSRRAPRSPPRRASRTSCDGIEGGAIAARALPRCDARRSASDVEVLDGRARFAGARQTSTPPERSSSRPMATAATC